MNIWVGIFRSSRAGAERDQFDRPDTLYVMVKDEQRSRSGCARLLPTDEPYLLGTVFPHLMGNQPMPASADVWEFSRYTTQLVDGEIAWREEAAERFRELLKAVCDTAFTHGTKRLITFRYVGVERIARNFGIHVTCRPYQMINGRPVVAFGSNSTNRRSAPSKRIGHTLPHTDELVCRTKIVTKKRGASRAPFYNITYLFIQAA